MYYEEKAINGILCHRGTPDGEWIPFTYEELTVLYLSTQVHLEHVTGELKELQFKFDIIKAACE
jgi:hypothetical protein